MALSFSDTKYQDCFVFHPAALAFSVRAASDSGRWVANIASGMSTGASAQNISRKRSLLI
jgi:hypothetical protein